MNKHGFYRAYLAKHFFSRSVTATQRYSLCLEKIRKERPSFQTKNLPELDESDWKDFADQYYKKNRPVVLRGFGRDFPAVKKWTPDYLKERWGELNVTLNDNRGLLSEKETPDFRTITLKTFLEGMQKGVSRYIRFSSLIKEEKSMRDDFDFETYKRLLGRKMKGEDPHLFIGPEGLFTPTHCAMANNLFLQVYGEKKWQIISPEYTRYLLPEVSRKFYFFSNVIPEDLLLGESSENSPAVFEVKLYPGDLLFNPPYYWHRVTNVTDTISLAYRFTTPFQAFKSSRFLTLMTFLGSDPNIIQQILHRRKKAPTQLLFARPDLSAKKE